MPRDDPDRSKERTYMRKYRATHQERIREYETRYRKRKKADPVWDRRIKDRQNKSAGVRIAMRRAVILAAKSIPCADCGQTFPHVCMDFHHVRGKKKFNVSLHKGRSVKTILAEIAKCIVLCSNCHRIRTSIDDKGPASQ